MIVKKTNYLNVNESFLDFGLTDKDFKDLVENSFERLPTNKIEGDLKFDIKTSGKQSKIEMTYSDDCKEGSITYKFFIKLFITIVYKNLVKTSGSIMPHPVLTVTYNGAYLELNDEDNANEWSDMTYSERVSDKRVFQINFPSIRVTSHYEILGKVLLNSLFKMFMPILNTIKGSKFLKFSETGIKKAANEISEKFLNGETTEVDVKDTLKKSRDVEKAISDIRQGWLDATSGKEFVNNVEKCLNKNGKVDFVKLAEIYKLPPYKVTEKNLFDLIKDNGNGFDEDEYEIHPTLGDALLKLRGFKYGRIVSDKHRYMFGLESMKDKWNPAGL